MGLCKMQYEFKSIETALIGQMLQRTSCMIMFMFTKHYKSFHLDKTKVLDRFVSVLDNLEEAKMLALIRTTHYYTYMIEEEW